MNWGVRKNKSAAARAPRPFSDPEELYLCLFAPWALDPYREQVECMVDGEQDIGLLFCYARAVETPVQARLLAEHIERCLEKLEDDQKVCSFLHILRGYTLYHTGQFTADVGRAVERSVRFLVDGSCTNQAPSQPPTQYIIDIPRLALLRYGMEMCGKDQDLWKTLLGYHVPQLSASSTPVKCESIVKKCFVWALEKLGSPAAHAFPPDILEVPCFGVDGGRAKMATAHVFCFLLTQYIAEPEVTDALSRSVYQCLQISVCDLLYTLSALILAGASPVERLQFDHLCASPGDLMDAAKGRAEVLLPAGRSALQRLLVFFLDMYALVALPTARSFREQQFMEEVCKRAEKLVLGVDGDQASGFELVEQSMFLADADKVAGEDGLEGARWVGL